MLRFRTALLATLVGVVLATVVAVGVSSFVNARFAVEDLTAQVIEQTALRIDQHVQDVLDVAVAQSRLAEEVLVSGIVDIDDPAATQVFFAHALQADGVLSFLSYGTENGEYWHATRDRDGSLSLQELLLQDDGRQVLAAYALRPDGTREETLRTHEGLEGRDPRNRPYYKAAVRAGHDLWTESYLFLTRPGVTQVPGVTRSVPVEKDGKLQGVLTADFDFWALSQVLSKITVGRSGFAYVVEQRSDGSQQIIAHPDPMLLTRALEGEDARERVPIDAFGDPVVRAFTRALPSDLADERVHIEQLAIDGETWAAGYLRVQGQDRPRWVIVAALPLTDVMSRVRQMNQVTLLVGSSALAFALIFALLLSSRLSDGLELLRDEIDQISRLQIPDRDLGAQPFRIRDLAEMGRDVDAMKHGLRSFSRYVPQGLVRKLLESGSAAELGAEERHVTVVFTDIVGFTTHVERTPRELMFQALSGYLDLMNVEIESHDGIVCQYLGDAIMALWGAPDDVADHPLKACRAAIAMKRRGDQLADSAPEGAPRLRTRFGVNTGPAMVGNIGAANRFNYVALGDTVNTAARLETLNKAYGTWQLISEDTAEAVKKHLAVRAVDWVRMKGKDRPVFVYELLGEKADCAHLEGAVEQYEEALRLYARQQFGRAIEAFEAAKNAFGGEDSPSDVLIARCREYAAHPPPSDWDGVYTMKTK